MKRLLIIVGGLILWFAGCGHGGGGVDISGTTHAESGMTAATSSDTTARYATIARSRFYGTVSYRFNESGTHVICIHNPRKSDIPMQTMRQLVFFIYDIGSETIIFEDSALNGAVTWEDDRHVRVTVTPGTVPGFAPHQYGYRLDAETGEIEPLNEQDEPDSHQDLSP